MRKSFAVVNILLAIILAYSPVSAVQQSSPSAEWSAVKAMPEGDEVNVKLKSGESLRGKVMSVTDTSLLISRKNKTETLNRSDISEVYQVRGKAAKGKFALIGAGVGAGVGVGMGAARNSPPVDDGRIYPIMGAVIGGGIGAAVGFLFGQTRRKRVLIYQAR
jgi:hypothetical protein